MIIPFPIEASRIFLIAIFVCQICSWFWRWKKTLSLRIQVCPKKGINAIILLWGGDWDHQIYSRVGYGSLGYVCFAAPKFTKIILSACLPCKKWKFFDGELLETFSSMFGGCQNLATVGKSHFANGQPLNFFGIIYILNIGTLLKFKRLFHGPLDEWEMSIHLYERNPISWLSWFNGFLVSVQGPTNLKYPNLQTNSWLNPTTTIEAAFTYLS